MAEVKISSAAVFPAIHTGIKSLDEILEGALQSKGLIEFAGGGVPPEKIIPILYMSFLPANERALLEMKEVGPVTIGIHKAEEIQFLIAMNDRVKHLPPFEGSALQLEIKRLLALQNSTVQVPPMWFRDP